MQVRTKIAWSAAGHDLVAWRGGHARACLRACLLTRARSGACEFVGSMLQCLPFSLMHMSRLHRIYMQADSKSPRTLASRQPSFHGRILKSTGRVHSWLAFRNAKEQDHGGHVAQTNQQLNKWEASKQS